MEPQEERDLPHDTQEGIEVAPKSPANGPCESEEKGRQTAFLSAESRWRRAIQGTTLKFEESSRARKPEIRFRGCSPLQYGHGSSLL
jgi:hypothetical protein